MKVYEYLVMWRDDEEMLGGTDYIQALNAQQAADFVRGDSKTIKIIEVARVCKNWK